EFAQDQLNYWEAAGHFKAENYDPDGPQARSLIRMVRAYRELGAEVKLVIMPLRSTLQSRAPANAKPCLLDVIHRAFPDDPPPIFDMETRIPDRYFSDEAHLSRAGADRLSKL